MSIDVKCVEARRQKLCRPMCDTKTALKSGGENALFADAHGTLWKLLRILLEQGNGGEQEDERYNINR